MPHLLPWWLILELLGVAAFPWALFLFRNLPDRGYGLAKALGLLLLAYGYWAAVTAGLLPNRTPALLLVLGVFLSGSTFLAWRQREELLLFLRSRRSVLLVEEAVFLGAFLSFAVFRMLVPDVTLTTAVTGLTTEQPMDLAFLASTLRGVTFPPSDPWLAGHAINYYYLGYLTLGLPARLAGATAPVAYNLALVTLFSLTAVGVFSLAMSAASLGRLGRSSGTPLSATPVIAGLAALLFALVAGNLVAIGAVLQRLGFGERSFFNDPAWWWGPSRVIADGTHAEPIDEFPAFSFVLGDLHPHLMALPFVLLVLGLALAWLARTEAPDARWPLRQPGEAALIGLVVGALGLLNTWDLPTYLGLFVAAIVVRRLWQGGASARKVLADIAGPALVLSALALVLYLPFYRTLSGLGQGIAPVASAGTRPYHYLALWGPLLAVAVPPVVAAVWARAHLLTGRSLGAGVAVALAPVAIWSLTAPFWPGLPEGMAVSASDVLGRWLLVLPPVALLGLALLALAPSPSEAEQPPGRTFLYLVVAGAAVAVLLPELFFVRDLFGTRMNTVFKVHYQAWVLFSLAGGVGLAWLLGQARPREPRARLMASAGVLSVMALLLLSLAYGSLAAATRVASSPGASPTLDGLATYRRLHGDEAAALEWLRSRAAADAVVLEAVGNDYTDFGRVSAATGVPTMIGWEGHELQWRSGAALFAGRRDAVAAIYGAQDAERARQLLGLYGVDYVFVGRLERQAYGEDVAERLAALLPELEPAYRSGEVIVLRVPGE